ncbi:MAG: hypothetical protein IMW89_13030 [Ktedonobacteraceae bacterium]|nr:hypothetical protein [Ktedonobacteraceae bacterium]
MMSNYRNRRQATGGLAGTIFIVGLILAFAFGFNLSIFFAALAFTALVGALGSGNSKQAYGGFHGFLWLMVLALFFATGNWIWFLVGVILSSMLGSLTRPILGWLSSMGLFAAAPDQQQPYYQPSQTSRVPQTPYYQPSQPPEPPQQPTEPAYQPYEQGYKAPASSSPAVQPESDQEGEGQYQYPSPSTSYEQPQAQYPEPMPPRQQQQ